MGWSPTLLSDAREPLLFGRSGGLLSVFNRCESLDPTCGARPRRGTGVRLLYDSMMIE